MSRNAARDPRLGEQYRSFVHLARDHAERKPSDQAYTFLDAELREDCSLAFREIDRAARAVAGTLQQRCGFGERAVLLLPTGSEFVKGFFGCLYAGVIAVPSYLPLSRKAAHQKRLEAIIRDAGARFVLTEATHVAQLRAAMVEMGLAHTVECIDTSVPAGNADFWHMPDIAADSIAFLQYTSGSTSAPKGVIVTHSNLLANETLIQRCFDERAGAIVVNWLPLYHDMGLIGNMLQPFFRGERAVSMAPAIFLADPINWLRAISIYQASTSGAPNFAYQLCVERASEEQCAGLDLRSWQLAYVGSEPIRAGTLKAFASKFAAYGFREESLRPCYGLAEATLLVSASKRRTGAKRLAVRCEPLRRGQVSPVNSSSADSSDSNPDIRVVVGCGSAVTGQSVSIVDPRTHLRCPDDQVGEIWVSLATVARGYWRRAEESRQTFAARITGESAAFLRTGDLGFIHAEELYVTGRMKDLIIIHGRNHVPQDIEMSGQECDACLQRDAGAAFSVEQDDEERLVLVQEVTRRGARAGSMDELLWRICAAIVDGHAVQPYEIVLLRPGTLPKTTSGKVRRQHTRELYLAGELNVVARLAAKDMPDVRNTSRRSRLAALQVGPNAALEQQVADVVREVLGFDVGVQVSLFEMGLDSLASTRLIARISARLRASIGLEDLYQDPTIRGIAAKVAVASSAGAADRPLLVRSRGQNVPLSYAQQRIWLFEQLMNSGAAYNIALAITLRGSLDAGALQAALQTLLDRHEVLRAVFPSVGGEPSVLIAAEAEAALEEVDISDLPAARREAQLHELRMQEASARFDLFEGPLLRLCLIRLSMHEHMLLLTTHHIVADGWSVAILIRELGALYGQYSGGRRGDLPTPQLQYADYAIWQRSPLEDDGRQAQLQFWRNQLAGAPAAIELPTDHPRLATRSYRGHSIEITLGEALTKKVSECSRRSHATVFSTLLTAANLLLSHWTGQRDIVLGTVIAGRKRIELESIVGTFINFLPLRTAIEPGQKVSDLLAKVSQLLLEVHTRDECPFDVIVDAVNPRRSATTNPLFNVAFLYQNFPAELPVFADLAVEMSESHTGSALLDLRFVTAQRGDRLVCAAEYSSDLFTQRTIEQLLQGFEHILEQMMDDPRRLVSSIQISAALQDQAVACRRGDAASRIVIAANFIAGPLEQALTFWSELVGLPMVVDWAPQDQLFQQLLDKRSDLASNSHGVNVIALSVAEWLSNLPADECVSERRQILRRNAEDFVAGICELQNRSSASLVICLCPSAAPQVPTEVDLLADVHAYLESHLAAVPGTHCVTHAQVERSYPVACVADRFGGELGYSPYTPEYFVALGTMISRRVAAIRRSPRKVIAVDCDDTLWSGICGEDGPDGIRITPMHLALQDFLVQQHAAGMLVCLCSRNNRADVEAVFRTREDMRLRERHIVASRIGWGPKSQAIAELARELDLALESFVFIDDSALECAEVRAALPAVTTLNLPRSLADRLAFLEHVWALDHLTMTDSAAERTQQYRQNRKRIGALAQHASLDEFLSSLQLRVEVGPMYQQHVDRVAELTHRTNQFNLTTIRRQPAAVHQYSVEARSRVLVVHVQDRFGDYGLVGALFLRVEPPTLIVDTFLLSCRVLGREVEYRVLNELGRMGIEGGLETVELRYEATVRNRPAFEFLQSVAGQFRQGDEAAATFRVPVEYASTAVRSATAPPPSLAPATRAPASSGQWAEPTEKVQLVADELRNVASISRAIDARFARTRGTNGVYLAARSELETRLAAICAEILNIDRVGIADDFFEIGGRSLLATQLLARVYAEYDVKIPLAELFERPTVAALATRVETYRWARELVSSEDRSSDDSWERVVI